MIELYVSGKKVDLVGTERILADYQIGSLDNIGQKDTTRTMEFDLPLTQNNLGIFQAPNVPLNSSRIPYRMLDAYMLDDGIDMKIYLCQLLSVKSTIRVRLFGNNTNFISLLRDLSLRDLDLSAYDHYWTPDNIHYFMPQTEGVCYPLIDYGDLDTAGNQIYLEQMFAAVFFVKLIQQMCADQGYTLTGNWMTDGYVQKWMIPFCNDRTAYHDGYTDNYPFSAGNATEDVHYVPGVDYPSSGAIIKFETEISDPGNHYALDGDYSRWLYTAEYNFVGVFHLNLSLRVISGTVSDYQVTLRRVRDGVESVLESWDGETEILDDGIGVDLDRDFLPHLFKAGDRVFIRAYLRLGGVLTYYEFKVPGGFDVNGNPNDYISLTSVTPYGPTPGDWWEVAPNLPDIAQTDFFKHILAYFGCLYVVDEEKKEVNVSFFDTIPGNKPVAKDWSGKVDNSEPAEIVYLLENYGRLNHCTYQDEDGINKPVGTDYDIVLDNDTVVPEKDLFTAPFGASLMNYKLEQLLNLAVIDLQVVDFSQLASVQPRALIADYITVEELSFVKDGVEMFTETAVNRPYFYLPEKTVNAGWQWSAERYNLKLILTINEFRTIKQLFRLKPADINQHDWFIPIWVDELQMYFYISLIEEYEYGGSASTLVHLNALPEDGEYYG